MPEFSVLDYFVEPWKGSVREVKFIQISDEFTRRYDGRVVDQEEVRKLACVYGKLIDMSYEEKNTVRYYITHGLKVVCSSYGNGWFVVLERDDHF